MKHIAYLVAALMLIGTCVAAHPCPPKKQPRDSRGRFVSAKPDTGKSLGQHLADGFRLTGGVRWDQEYAHAKKHRIVKDGHDYQTFVGASLTLPIVPRVEAFGNYDRDLVDGPDWSARVGVSYRPWGK